MKRLIQPMRVQRADGSTVTTCCGPAALREISEGATGYEPVGVGTQGSCCHTDPAVGRWGAAA